jgi:hypothetical protein
MLAHGYRIAADEIGFRSVDQRDNGNLARGTGSGRRNISKQHHQLNGPMDHVPRSIVSASASSKEESETSDDLGFQVWPRAPVYSRMKQNRARYRPHVRR